MGPPRGRHQVALGASFRDADERLHTVRYVSKPTTVALSAHTASIRVRGRDVDLRLQSTDGEQTAAFTGAAERHEDTECVLVCGADGNWTLERLDLKLDGLKAAEGAARPAKRGATRSQARSPRRPPAVRPSPARSLAASSNADEGIDEAALFGEGESSDDEFGAPPSPQQQGIQLRPVGGSAGAGGSSVPPGGAMQSPSLSDSGE